MSTIFFHAHRRFTRPVLTTIGKRLLATVVLVGAFSSVAGAYTLVMRNGRRVEVPAKFVLTDRTLTYEAAPGINVTLLLAVIDIGATERANNETRGSFFKHAEQEAQIAPLPPQKASVTVTNRDLEPARQARLSSERAYEKRRLELGLPSIEESRRLQAEQEDALLAMSRRRADEEADNEAYWRGRARSLRSEIVTVDTQIVYLRSRLAEYNDFSSNRSIVTDVYPIRPRRSRSGVLFPNQGGILASRRGGRVARPVPGYGYPNGYPYGYPNGYPYGYPNRSIYGYGNPGPFDYDNDSYQRASLEEKLNGLLVTRAGLSARWLELEDEARTAKVPQVWLEPY